MTTRPHSDASDDAPPRRRDDADYRPDSASIIHTVATRRDNTGAMKDRETVQREQVERTNVALLLHALHEIADDRIPPAQRRLIRETEVQRAISVLRRFFLLHPSVRLEQLLEHCERTTANDRNVVAHLIDPLQLRHVLTFHTGIPDAQLTAAELAELDQAIQYGPEAAIVAWFARIGDRSAMLPKSTPAYLRTVFERSWRAFVPAELLQVLSFESAVLTLRIQGVIGFEDNRLFFSMLKQIAGETINGLESYLESGETNHAVLQHRSAGNPDSAEYFRRLAYSFDHSALPNLERKVADTAIARSSPPPPPEPVEPEPEAPPPPEPKRGFLSGLRGFGQSFTKRE